MGGYGPWGAPMWGVWWIVPLLGMSFLVVMLVLCARMMRGMMAGGGVCGHGGHATSDTDLRREVQALREEIQKLRAGNG